MQFEKIKTIVFDLDDTLRFNDPHAHDYFSNEAERLTQSFSEEQRRTSQLWEHSYWATSEDLVADLKLHGESTEPFWLNYSAKHLKSLGLSEGLAQELAPKMHTYMRETYRPNSHVPNDTLKTLQQLSKAGFHIGLLTNRPKPAHAEMHTIGLDTYLDFFLTASQLGAFKPSKEIFERLLAFLGLTNEQVVYVGDNYYADVIGARNAGVLPILHNWKQLYSNVDCLEIKSISELPAILEPVTVS